MNEILRVRPVTDADIDDLIALWQATGSVRPCSVRARIGRGIRTNTSRRLGNVESQLSTANRPTTNIVVAIRKCSPLHVSRRANWCGRFLASSTTSTIDANPRLTNISSAANCPSSLLMSPLGASNSRSITRNRNSRNKTRNGVFFMAQD